MPETYLRVRFYSIDDDGYHSIEAVWCRDFFADEIAAEAEYAQTGEHDPNDGWYTKNFAEIRWVCPDTTNLTLLTGA